MEGLERGMTDITNPYVKLGMQFSLSLLLVGFLGAAWWTGRIPTETALPLIMGIVTIWLPSPIRSSVPEVTVTRKTETTSTPDLTLTTETRSISPTSKEIHAHDAK